MSAPAQLNITINADTAEAASRIESFFHAFADNAQKLSGMSSFLEEFGAKIAAAFTVGSIVEFTKRAIDVEATLQRMSQKSGVSVAMLEELRGEAVKNDLAFEELDAGLVMFADRIFQAVRHGGQFAEVFRDLKISLVEADGQLRPIDDILLSVAQKFQAMPAGPQKAALAMELFGRSGRQFIQLLSLSTTELVARMKEHGAEQERNAEQAEKFHQSIAELSLALQRMWMDISSSLIPTLQRFVESMKDGVHWLEFAIKDGGALNQVLKQTAILLGSIAVAKAAANISSVFGWAMTSAAGDVAYALGLILGRLKLISLSSASAFLTSPVVAFTAVIAALAEEIQTGVEMWKQWKAAKEEALSGEKVKEQDTQLEAALYRAIDAQEKAHAISEKVAGIYRDAVRDAFKTSPDAIALHDRLTNLLRSLRTHVEGPQQQKQTEHATIGPSDREIKMAEARIAAWLKIEDATNAISEAQNEEFYKKRTISLETYFAVKKRLLEKSAQDELTALQRELKSVDQQRHDPQNAANKEKQDELSIKREALLASLIEVRAKLRAAEAKLAGEKWVEEQNNAKKTEEIEQGRAELRLSHIKAEQSLIQANPYLDDLEKAQQIIPWLQKENAEIESQIALEKKRQHTANLKDDALLESQKRVEALKQEREQIHLTQQAAEGKTSFSYQFATQFAAVANTFATIQENLAKGWSTMTTTMRDSFAAAIDDMLWKGEHLKQAVTSFGLAILHSMVQSFAQMTSSWILQHTVMAAWSSLFHAKETAETAAHTTTQVGIHTAGETAKTGATAGGAAMRGVIRLGETIYHALQTGFRVVTHIAGELAMTAVSLAQSLLRRIGAFLEAQPYIFLAAVKAASSVADIPFVGPILAPIAAATTFAALEALAVFKKGGYTGDGSPDDVAGAVHKGEWVFTAEQTSRIGKPALEAIAAGRMPMISGTPKMMHSTGVGASNIHLALVADDLGAQDYLDSVVGEKHVVKIMGKNIHHLVRR